MIQVGGERAPAPGNSVRRDEAAHPLDVASGPVEEGDAADAAVAEELRGDPLAHAPFEQGGLAVQGQGRAQVGMRMQVDEAGSDHAVPRVEGGRRSRQALPHRDDAIPRDPDVGAERGPSRPVHHLAVGDDQIQGGLRVSGRGEVDHPGA